MKMTFKTQPVCFFSIINRDDGYDFKFITTIILLCKIIEYNSSNSTAL